MNTKNPTRLWKVGLVLAVFFTPILVCVILIVITALNTPTTQAQKIEAPIPQAKLPTLIPTLLALFTDTPTDSVPSATPTTVPTAMLAPSPTPAFYGCKDLIAKAGAMTSAQWDDFRARLNGADFTNYTGTVESVKSPWALDETYEVTVSLMDNCSLYLSYTDKAAALALNKGQTLTVSGKVDTLSSFMGSVTILSDNFTAQ